MDYRGRYSAAEGLLFLAYGISRNLAVELEGAYISAELKENEGRPEALTYFETTFPLQRTRRLIGTPDWEFKLGVGLTRGLSLGTWTVRAAIDYTREERKFDAGEYAIEYLRRLSRSWRIVGAIEGNQLDEVSLITEAQWHFHPRAFLKINNGWGLTPNATDLAPEVGILFSV